MLALLLGACAGPNPVAPTPSVQVTQSVPTGTPSPTPPSMPTSAPIREDTATILNRLSGEACPDSEGFTCVTLAVPRDHFDPASTVTIDVVFAVLSATGERKGMFVTATGGPGTSGIASAAEYTAAFDPRISEHFDIVFFDQRGVALSGGLQCAAAAAVFYQFDVRADTPEREAATTAAARQFAEDCVREMGHPPMLPYLGTRQAVEDLEVFRQALGDEKFWLYGESYGTQFAQTYAAAHPERLAGLILDGTVDLTLSGAEFLAQQARAFNDVLVMTLEDCNAQPDCAADMGGDALAVYDTLAARLAESPVSFTFPLPSGGRAVRSFSLADLETAAADNLYSEGGRLLLQRALAAASRVLSEAERSRRIAPLARLLYIALGLDPDTLEAIPDPTYSDAVYYAVECSDYTTFSGAPAERAQGYIRAGDQVERSVPRLSSIFYGDLPCAFWPSDSLDVGRPSPGALEGVPTLVLGATADPATPVSNGEQVFSRLADAYLITTEGGAHVIFGRGDACPDDIVTAFLVEDELPDQREIRCEGAIADAYVPLAPVDASAFATPLEALISVDDEIYYLPEYYNWDGATPTSAGCPFGGRLEFENVDGRHAFELTGCAFSGGFVMTGTGVYDLDLDRLTLEVGVTGLAEGRLAYRRDGDGRRSVTGEYDGRPVDLTE